MSTDTRCDMYENACYASTTYASVDRKEKKEVFSTKKCFCILMIVVAVILLIIAIFICLAFAFIEISSLKSTLKSKIKNTSSSMFSGNNETTDYISILNDRFEILNTSFGQEFAKLNSKCEANGQILNASVLKLNQLRQDYSMLQNRFQQLIHNLGLYPSNPAASCATIRKFAPSSSSGHYWITSSNGSAVRVYCDMTRSYCGNITGGWMRVAELDMRDSSSQCPSALRMRTACSRTCMINSDNAHCSSVTFTTHGFNYSRICGMIRAYQVGTPDSFGGRLRTAPITIDNNYVDGISLTHGTSPRHHIWTFAAQSDGVVGSNNCNDLPPVGRSLNNNLFCDVNPYSATCKKNRLLWNGGNCTNCASSDNPPWFYRELQNHATTDDIEMRVCRDEGVDNEDMAIEAYEFYIQ